MPKIYCLNPDTLIVAIILNDIKTIEKFKKIISGEEKFILDLLERQKIKYLFKSYVLLNHNILNQYKNTYELMDQDLEIVQWHIEEIIGVFYYCSMPSDTPLHYAVRIRNIGVVNTLVGYKVDINAVNLYKQTPLHYIANMVHVDKNDVVIAEILLKNQANINAIDNCDGTPLNCAINNSIHANIKYNPNYAVGNRNKELIILLLKYEAKPDLTSFEMVFGLAGNDKIFKGEILDLLLNHIDKLDYSDINRKKMNSIIDKLLYKKEEKKAVIKSLLVSKESSEYLTKFKIISKEMRFDKICNENLNNSKESNGIKYFKEFVALYKTEILYLLFIKFLVSHFNHAAVHNEYIISKYAWGNKKIINFNYTRKSINKECDRDLTHYQDNWNSWDKILDGSDNPSSTLLSFFETEIIGSNISTT